MSTYGNNRSNRQRYDPSAISEPLDDQPVVPTTFLDDKSNNSITSLSSDDENEDEDLTSFLEQPSKETFANSPQHNKTQQQTANAPSPGSTVSFSQLSATSSSSSSSPSSNATFNESISNKNSPTSIPSLAANAVVFGSASDSDSDDNDDAMIASLLNTTGAASNPASPTPQQTQLSPVRNDLKSFDNDSESENDSEDDYQPQETDQSSARKKKRQAVEEEEWVPYAQRKITSTRKRNGKNNSSTSNAGTNKRQRSAAQNYKDMPYGGLIGQDTFLKVIEHGRVTQTFSDISEKELIQNRRNLPSFCFLSIFESSEHTGSLVRKYPYCDATGLISKKLVKRIRKELLKYKKEVDILKLQDYALMQTPYGLNKLLTNSASASSSIDTGKSKKIKKNQKMSRFGENVGNRLVNGCYVFRCEVSFLSNLLHCHRSVSLFF